MQTCFIIMPITTPEAAVVSRYAGDRDHFKHVLDHLFVPAVTKAGFEPVSPVAEGADLIHGNIIANLHSADLVLCDMSCLNANVFFELGIRTALDKPVSMIQDDVSDRIPFDTAIVNFHTYASSLAPWHLESEIDSLATHIAKSMPKGETANSLWRYFGVSSRAHAIDDATRHDDRFVYVMQQLDALRKQLRDNASSQPPISKFGQLVRDKRLERSMTQEELARESGYGKRTIERLEHGFRVGEDTMQDVCEVLEIEFDSIDLSDY